MLARTCLKYFGKHQANDFFSIFHAEYSQAFTFRVNVSYCSLPVVEVNSLALSGSKELSFFNLMSCHVCFQCVKKSPIDSHYYHYSHSTDTNSAILTSSV